MEKINKGKLIVVGSANTDLVIHAPHFPQPGETVIGDSFMTNFGGKGANQAVAAARLGIQTVFVGKVGSDEFGKATMDHLTKEGVDASYLFTSPEKPSGVALITTVDGGENSIVVNPGANFDLTEADIEKAREAFKSASIVLMQLETPTSYYGVIWTVLNLTVGIAALYSDRVEQALGMRRSNGLILLVIVGGYAALALLPLTYACLAILFLFYIVRGFATPILKGYINQMTFSEMRATVLSIRNFIIRLLFAAIAPFIGWLNDYYSLQVALLISALIIGIPGFLFLVLQFRLKHN